MGLKNWIAARILKSKVRNIKKVSGLEHSIDGMLAEEMKTMTSTNRTIDKLMKVKLMRQESQNTLDKIRDLDTELEEEVEEEGDNFEDQIKGILMKKLLGGVASPQETRGSEGAPVDYGDPLAQAIPQPENPVIDAVNNMTPEQMNTLKRKFL